MKRRAISFITVLALCLSLCPMRALADYDVDKRVPLTDNMTDSVTYNVSNRLLFDTKGYSYTVLGQTAVSVKSTGTLYLTNGRIESKNGSGIEVQAGGRLYIDQPGMTVIGTTYGLDIASGTTVQLSGGTFTGGEAAIQAEDYCALLVSGYAYFDESGDPIQLFDANGGQITTEVTGKKTVMVKACTDHVYAYKANTGKPTHDGTCIYCGAKIGPLPCTFYFDENGHAACKDNCGHALEIMVNPAESVYDGTSKPSDLSVTVKLDRNITLAANSDYTEKYTTIVDVGETTVTVIGETYIGTYETQFRVIRAKPVLEWSKTDTDVDFDGRPVEADDLPEVTITNVVEMDKAGFPQLSYEYRKVGNIGFTDGLPTEVGTYEIKACLPEQDNYEAAETDQYLKLTIKLITALETAPIATKPIYNGSAQELVTGGKIHDGAVGAVIEFGPSEDGPWSTDIPTGIDAVNYEVWYRVVGTNDYEGVEPTKIDDVLIQRKPITPDVKLSYYTCVYDGGYKRPAVTVIDPEDRTVLLDTEYEVTYANNQNVSTKESKATVTVTDKEGGNYAITPAGVSVTFEITAADQDALTITNVPNTVTYGDVFTLVAAGGSGNGTVTWKITAVKDGDDTDITSSNFDTVAVINEASGQVTVTGVGTVTVQATKSGTVNDGNHADATAQWTFTAGKRSVVATVTAENKTYDGNNTATVHAVVEQGLVSGDTLEITGLTGTFTDANASTGKTVDVNTDGAEIKVNGTIIVNNSNEKNENYTVTFSSKTVTADIYKAATTVTAPTATTPTYNGAPQKLVSAATPNPSTVPVEYSLYENGPWDTNIPEATNAGSYEVWYRVKESENYLGTAAEKVIVTIQPKEVSNPTITLSQSSYVYDGSEKKPTVTEVKDGDDTIPSSEYTVTYSNNVNVGTNATVNITDNAGGNYEVSGTATFTITAGQAVLTGTPRANNLTYNGQPQDLVSVGTASGGHLEYALETTEAGTTGPGTYSEQIPQGTKAGQYKVYYKVVGDGNHNGIDTPSVVYVTIQPKTVSSPVITLTDESGDQPYSVEYNGQKHEPGVASVVDGNDTIPADEYTVSYSNNVDAGTATVHIIDNSGGNYTVNGSKTFEIKKAKAGFTTAPEVRDLTYNGRAQSLVTPGVAEGGTAVYSLEEGVYSTAIPTGTDSGTYNVLAKVLGDKNHEDSTPITISNVTIAQKTVNNPEIQLSSTTFRYNGSEQKPTITVIDEQGNVIPENEYKVTYAGDTVNVGPYTVEIESRENNYKFNFADAAKSTITVTIVPADQETLTITGKPSVVYYGDTIQLSTAGGSGNGTVEWTIETGENEGLIKAGGSAGQFVITGVGDITIKATRTSNTGNYETVTDTWTFHAYPKPVTAVVTAANKVYDGTVNADLSVTVPGAPLQVTSGVTGTFDSADVGSNKTVTIDSSGAAVTGTNADKYTITYPDTTTASITPATLTVTSVAANPDSGNANLKYTGERQKLVTTGSVKGVDNESDGAIGYVVYSLDGINYGLSVPTGTDAGTYTVWYKAVSTSENYKDSAPALIEVTIDPKEVNAGGLNVICSPTSFPYDGTQKTPYITVKDGATEIPASEYTVVFDDDERIEIQKYQFTITAKPDSNYKFADVTGEFYIVEADQAPLSIVVSGSLMVSYGDTFRLSTVGGSGTGAITWSVDRADIATIEGGVVTVTGTGNFTVTVYKEGTDGSYGQSNEDSVTFTAKPKQITPVITVDDKNYDGKKDATLTASWKSGDMVDGDNITITVTGEFVTADVGTSKQVTITMNPSGVLGNYEIIPPTAVTGSIYKVNAKLSTEPTAANNLVYSGSPQALLAPGGETVDGIGTVEYSLSEKGAYSADIPKGTDAGTYTVWYRVAESVNWTGIGPVCVEVTIEKATPTISETPGASPITAGQPLSASALSGGKATFDGKDVSGTFAWTDDSIIPPVGASPQEVTFTPTDTVNFKSATAKITIKVEAAPDPEATPDPAPSQSTEPEPDPTPDPTQSTIPDNSTNTPAPSNPGTESAFPQTTVRNGIASTVVSVAAGNKLVNEAVANRSETIVIKPEITGDVTKTEVSVPASTVSRISSETDAALTVSTPIADVTIPNGALGALSNAGGTVSVVAERVDNIIVLTLTANGKDVGDLPGGLTLTIPMEDTGPGTVAVLIYEDGTRETVRKSVAGDIGVRIPLSGSATVEIVDNSREFVDVPADSWAADAVAFASAHELFNGTGETTFSPELSMSRAMLATVLYNLESNPDTTFNGSFADVEGDSWYAEGVSWAANCGIVAGYDNGSFGANDSITREQFAVMLWRYAGKPTTDGQTLDFTDGDQASGYAIEALHWAAANGILNGYDDGSLDPNGLATRAQAAQMLKNFIENIER